MKKNVLFMLLSVFSIQGSAFLSQFILAGILPAESFAIVRTVESALQLLSTIAPWGMSLLVIRLASQDRGQEESARMLTSYIGLAGITALLIASLGSVILASTSTQFSIYLSTLIWLVVITSLSRTSLNYFYGKEQFGLISMITFATSLLSLIILYVLANKWQLNGWVAARYLTELIVLAIAIKFIWGKLVTKLVAKTETIKTLIEGAAISMSLVFRSAIENTPLLVLAYVSLDQKEIALYGLCTLLISGAMVLPTSIISVMLPRYGNMQRNGASRMAVEHVKFERIVIATGLAVALLLMGLGLIISNVFSEKYSGLYQYLAIAAFIVPVRAFTTINANVLFVSEQTATGTKINLICAISSVLLSYVLYLVMGLWGVVTASILVEIAAGILFKLHSIRITAQSISG